MTGSEKYEAAAKVAEWQGADNRHIADQQRTEPQEWFS